MDKRTRTALPQPVETFILVLIIANVIAVIISTDAGLFQQYRPFFDAFEVFSLFVFGAEYIARLWVAPRDPRFAGRLSGRLRYALQPMSIVDLLAALPFYFFLPGVDLRMIRALRLLRVFRILKLHRYSDAGSLLVRVLRREKENLGVVFIAGLIILVIASTAIYYFEHPHQPDAFPSIPAAMWWGVSTLTTVGHGDINPATPPGRIVGAIITIMSVLLVALPTGFLASAFATETGQRQPRRCPHCGEALDEKDNP